MGLGLRETAHSEVDLFSSVEQPPVTGAWDRFEIEGSSFGAQVSLPVELLARVRHAKALLQGRVIAFDVF